MNKWLFKPIYTNFEAQMGDETSFDLPGFSAPDRYVRSRAKARHFLQANKDHVTIHKLRSNEPLFGG